MKEGSEERVPEQKLVLRHVCSKGNGTILLERDKAH
jgi:hypothetical protein